MPEEVGHKPEEAGHNPEEAGEWFILGRGVASAQFALGRDPGLALHHGPAE